MKMIMKMTDTIAHPLMMIPKKKISSLMSSHARGMIMMSSISESKIVSSVFIIVCLYLILQIYEISLEYANLF